MNYLGQPSKDGNEVDEKAVYGHPGSRVDPVYGTRFLMQRAFSLYDRFGPVIMSADDGIALSGEIRAALEANERVVIDFARTRLVLNAFMNGVLGGLYERLDARIVDDQLSITGETPNEAHLFELSREHARSFHNDPLVRERAAAALAALFTKS